MMIAKIDVYGEEELSANIAKNRIVIFEKTDMQRRFENWFNQGLTNESRKTACLSESW
jgi:hypothetical protein